MTFARTHRCTLFAVFPPTLQATSEHPLSSSALLLPPTDSFVLCSCPVSMLSKRVAEGKSQARLSAQHGNGAWETGLFPSLSVSVSLCLAKASLGV
jgi:hypothetical protein